MKTTDHVLTERHITTCDVCQNGDSTTRRMYICLGCQKDVCSACVKFEDTYEDYSLTAYLCPACQPSFITVNNSASALISAAHAEADKMIDAWKAQRRQSSQKSNAVRFSFGESSTVGPDDISPDDVLKIVNEFNGG